MNLKDLTVRDNNRNVYFISIFSLCNRINYKKLDSGKEVSFFFLIRNFTIQKSKVKKNECLKIT